MEPLSHLGLRPERRGISHADRHIVLPKEAGHCTMEHLTASEYSASTSGAKACAAESPAHVSPVFAQKPHVKGILGSIVFLLVEMPVEALAAVGMENPGGFGLEIRDQL